MTKGMPYAASRLTSFIRKRILELRPRKNQVEIAVEAGFVNTNMLLMIKSGKTKLPLDRVPALAKALDVIRNCSSSWPSSRRGVRQC